MCIDTYILYIYILYIYIYVYMYIYIYINILTLCSTNLVHHMQEFGQFRNYVGWQLGWKSQNLGAWHTHNGAIWINPSSITLFWVPRPLYPVSQRRLMQIADGKSWFCSSIFQPSWDDDATWPSYSSWRPGHLRLRLMPERCPEPILQPEKRREGLEETAGDG